MIWSLVPTKAIPEVELDMAHGRLRDDDIATICARDQVNDEYSLRAECAAVGMNKVILRRLARC